MKIRQTALFLLVLSIFLPTQSWGLNAQQVYEKVNDSIVKLYGVDNLNKKRRIIGSAVAITPNILATNCHIAMSGNRLVVKTRKQIKKAKLTLQREGDLCLIEVKKANFIPITMRDSRSVKVGEDVYAIGNPSGLEGTISRGIISNRHAVKGAFILQSDAAVSPGSSGGGLFDQEGKLVGITTIAHRYNDIVFAIPTEWIVKAMSYYQENHKRYGDKPMLLKDNRKSLLVKQSGNTRVKQIGLYGHVHLLSNNGKCFMFMVGQNLKNRIEGSIIWNPRFPKILSIFPYTASAPKALKIIRKQLPPPPAKLTLKKTKHLLFFDKQAHALYEPTSHQANQSILILKLKASPLSFFMSGKPMVLHTEDSREALGYKTLRFDIKQFSGALAGYHVGCG